MATTDKGGSCLNGRWCIVKEGVKVRSVLSGFGCDLDMQDTVVDREAHKNYPYTQALVNARNARSKQRGDTEEEAN